MLERHGVNSIMDVLFKFIQRSNVDKLNTYLISLDDITRASVISSSAKANGDYLVTVAARHGRLDVLKLLREDFNACLEVDNKDGKRPIHEAAQHGHADCVAYLIGQNVEVDAFKRADWTPLMLACTKVDLVVVRVLIEEGKAIFKDVKNKDGWTAFHIACREGHVDILRYFLDLDDSLWRSESAISRTPLHTAVLHGKTEAVGILLDYVSTEGLRVRDRCGLTPFFDAIKGGHATIVRMLIESLSTVSSEDSLLLDRDAIGRRPIDFAAMFGDDEIFDVVLTETAKALRKKSKNTGEWKEKEEEEDYDGMKDTSKDTSIDSFVRKALLGRNDHFNRTPLHYAALEGHLSVVKLIVDRLSVAVEVEEGLRALNINEILTLDGDGKSPIDLARIGRHSHCEKFLLELSI